MSAAGDSPETPEAPDGRSLDEKLIEDALEALEIVGCQFFACHGPTLHPMHMRECMPCVMVARLRHRLGRPVRNEAEEAYRLMLVKEHDRDLRQRREQAAWERYQREKVAS